MMLICYGTRPEIIKLFPVIRELDRRRVDFQTLFTGQHLDLYEDVRALIPDPDIHLEPGRRGPSDLTESLARIVQETKPVLDPGRFHTVVVQGDTTSACALAQAAFYRGIRVGHVEAGLRSWDLRSPFPEEGNRKIISAVADLHFAPTRQAADNLRAEGARRIFLTGNTIVDALGYYRLERRFDPLVVVTIHRRENHGRLDDIFRELNRAAGRHPDIEFVFPIHPNPNVQARKSILSAPNLKVIPPVGYPEMLDLISRASFLISDSGGLQEEAVYFAKKILIVRDNTERPETVASGFGRLVGPRICDHLTWALERIPPPKVNPFGDGAAARRIVDVLEAGESGGS